MVAGICKASLALKGPRDENIQNSRCATVGEMLQFLPRERDFHKNRLLDSDAAYAVRVIVDGDWEKSRTLSRRALPLHQGRVRVKGDPEAPQLRCTGVHRRWSSSSP